MAAGEGFTHTAGRSRSSKVAFPQGRTQAGKSLLRLGELGGPGRQDELQEEVGALDPQWKVYSGHTPGHLFPSWDTPWLSSARLAPA